MDRTRLEIRPGVWLDIRRAVYLEEERLLVVADLHLGYAWAHRYNGQMLPLGGGDKLIERLTELCSCYKPSAIAILGDIVHQAVRVTAVAEEFKALVSALAGHCETRLILGNHDKKLQQLVGDDLQFSTELRRGRYLLLHGNSKIDLPPDTFAIMGHEHPAISLGDGIMGARFPCFLVSEQVLVLPAFSLWAAGSDIRNYNFMSPLAAAANFERAIAICGQKLLPVRLRDESTFSSSSVEPRVNLKL